MDDAGASISNGSIVFAFSREVPIILLPFAPTRWVNESKTVATDAKGAAEVTWPNMSLAARVIFVAGVSNPITPVYALGGSVAVRTPDGKSTWDVGTNYTARIVVDRSKHVATVRPE